MPTAPTRVAAAVGAFLIVVLLCGSALGAGPAANGAESGEADVDGESVLVDSFDRLHSEDYNTTIVVRNRTAGGVETSRFRYVVSNSDRRALTGQIVDGVFHPSSYWNAVAEWDRVPGGGWELRGSYRWDATDFSTVPRGERLSGTDVRTVERTGDEVVISVENVDAGDGIGDPRGTNESWTVRVDTDSGNLLEVRKAYDTDDGHRFEQIHKFEYGPTVSRPEGVPFSVRETLYRVQSAWQLVVIGTIGLVVLVSVVVYRRR